MTDKQDLLVEIGTEELPPKSLAQLSQAFLAGVRSQLKLNKLDFADIRPYASPRRLALLVTGLDVAQASEEITRKGPAVTAAYDAAGSPTKAAEGFARSCGVPVSELATQETAKGAWLVFRQVQTGKQTGDLVAEIVSKSLADLPIPKRMRWGDGDEEFVRPVHWVLLLFGDRVVDDQVLGIRPGRNTYGHRFHHPGPIEVSSPGAYEALLQDKGRVCADMDRRLQMIREQVKVVAEEAGCDALIDADLLQEVTALVEWPTAIMGTFDPQFLQVPAEALIKTMQEHQKYFPVLDSEGQLKPRFIAVSNITSRDPEQVRSGNERVIRPRFSDAAFFWKQDLKKPLDDHVGELKAVVFQKRLGTLYEKSQRISRLAGTIAAQLDLDPALTARAAHLCKCDLMTHMVGEFPGLQGTMGRYYAQKGGEPSAVAAAMEEQYLPRHAGDRLPESDCGRAVAIADRLDTIVGIFAIGEKPSGVKDPFGLRRAALGVLRILIETPLPLDLQTLLQDAAEGLAEKLDAQSVVNEVFGYMMDRLKAYYGERDIQPDVVDAVLARRPTAPSDIDLRVRAVSAFRRLPEAESLAAANKRIRNILRKTGDPYPEQPDSSLLSETSEVELAAQVADLATQVEPLFRAGRYTEALTQLASLRLAVDRFFDEVMVMCDQEALRRNRLALLASLGNLFLQVADLSRLSTDPRSN